MFKVLTTETLEQGVKYVMFKVNNKDTRTTPICSSVSVVKFERVNAG